MLATEFKPTGFDGAIGGFFEYDDPRRAWLVVPVIKTRDSGPLDCSNFDAALAILGGESDTVEVHSFGHWACGWFEKIIVSPERAAEVEAIAEQLENYPVLSDEDFSAREYDMAVDCWNDFGADDFARAVAEMFGLADTTRERIADAKDAAWQLQMNHAEYKCDDSGASFNFDWLRRDEFTRDWLAQWLRENCKR